MREDEFSDIYFTFEGFLLRWALFSVDANIVTDADWYTYTHTQLSVTFLREKNWLNERNEMKKAPEPLRHRKSISIYVHILYACLLYLSPFVRFCVFFFFFLSFYVRRQRLKTTLIVYYFRICFRNFISAFTSFNRFTFVLSMLSSSLVTLSLRW